MHPIDCLNIAFYINTGALLSGPGRVTLNQNRETGFLLETLNCTSTETASYRILAISPNINFLRLHATSGELRLAVDSIDLNPAEYLVSLECTYSLGNDSANLIVVRADENEFPPTFAGGSGPIVVSITEIADVSTVVRQVTATDRDLGSYGTITYSIATPGVESTFAIHESTGTITLLMTLDFEQRSLYQFDVVASNAPTASGDIRSNTALVTVNVIDVDDTSPVFNVSNYARSLPENNAERIDVLTVQCTDRDTLDSRIRYGFVGEEHGPFQLSTITGELSVLKESIKYRGKYKGQL